jgi:hypothetical protein
MRGNQPIEALHPADATPRITPETVGRLIEIIDQARKIGVGNFPVSPAIGVYVIAAGPSLTGFVNRE